MAQFTVHPEALHAFAKRVDGYGDELDQLAASVREARVGRDAFGHIPMVGSRIYEAYDQHVDQAETATKQAGEAVHATAQNADKTATHYESAEQHNGGH